MTAIDKKPDITIPELSSSLNISFETVRYHVKDLKKKGIIIHKGPTKGGYWLVVIK